MGIAKDKNTSEEPIVMQCGVLVVGDIGYRTADDMHEDTDPHTLGH